jgi:CBS domain-containing protein
MDWHSAVRDRPLDRTAMRGEANCHEGVFPTWRADVQVVDVMTTDVISVTPDPPIKDAARLMFRNRVSGLPVCDESSCLIGIITEADFLRLEVARQEADQPPPVETVGEVMNRSVLTIGPEQSIADAARAMVINDVNRLPVVDSRSHILGIISRLDVVAVFTRPDDVIEDEIREDVIRRVLFVDPDSVGVSVANGVVRFEGEIGTRTEARLLEEVVRRLDGVMRVENGLSWRIDDEAR